MNLISHLINVESYHAQHCCQNRNKQQKPDILDEILDGHDFQDLVVIGIYVVTNVFILAILVELLLVYGLDRNHDLANS